VPWPYPDDGAETFVRHQAGKNRRKAKKFYHWVLTLRSGEPDAIGTSIFDRGPTTPKGNRGFWLAEPYWSRGLMTEAIAAVNDFASIRLASNSSMSATWFPMSVTSRLEKTGAEFVGYIELAHHNGQSKSERWRVTRENWLRLSQK